MSTSRSLLPFGSSGSRICLLLRYASCSRPSRGHGPFHSSFHAQSLPAPTPPGSSRRSRRVAGPDVDADGRRAAVVGRLDRGVLEVGEDDQLVGEDDGLATEPFAAGGDVVVGVLDGRLADDRDETSQEVNGHLSGVAEVEGSAEVAEGVAGRG